MYHRRIAGLTRQSYDDTSRTRNCVLYVYVIVGKQWQRKDEAASFPWNASTLDPNAATMHVQKFRNDIEAQSYSPRLAASDIWGAIETLEEAQLRIFRDANALILYTYLDHRLAPPRADLPQRERDLTIRRTILDGIL